MLPIFHDLEIFHTLLHNLCDNIATMKHVISGYSSHNLCDNITAGKSKSKLDNKSKATRQSVISVPFSGLHM